MNKARAMRTFPIVRMTNPRSRGLVQVYEDRWWAVSKDEGLYFYGTDDSPYLSPQCNANRSIAERVVKDGLIAQLGNFQEVRQIPLVFVPILINDYV